MEERVSRLEGAYEQVDQRLGDLTQAVARVDAKVDALRADMDARFDTARQDSDAKFEGLRRTVESRFNALVVLMAATWTSVVAGIVAVVVRT